MKGFMKWIQTKQCDYILSKWTHKICMDNMHVHSLYIVHVYKLGLKQIQIYKYLLFKFDL